MRAQHVSDKFEQSFSSARRRHHQPPHAYKVLDPVSHLYLVMAVLGVFVSFLWDREVVDRGIDEATSDFEALNNILFYP